jgi:hypothetical protein
VAKALRAKFPALRLLICADNDQFTDGNPGVAKAREACEATGAAWVAPSFDSLETRPTDFNDLHALQGAEEVRDQVMAALENVVPLRSAVERRELENIIRAEDDFDVLTGRVADLVRRNKHISSMARNALLREIARKSKASFSDLKAKRREDDPGTGERASSFMPELNARHAVVPVGGATFIMNIEHDPVLDRRLITYSRTGDFETRYHNRRTIVRADEMSIADAWLLNADRRQYDGVIFEPGTDRPGYFNLFDGWGVVPRPGNCSAFQDLIHTCICAEDRAASSYVWHWLAHLFQKPCELPGVAIVLRGGRGTGKNTFVDAIGKLVGRAHYLPLSSMSQVTGRFSGHLADLMLVFANEAIWGGDKQGEGALKTMITDSLTTCERKGKDIISVPNFKRVIVATNEDWAVPVGMDERRFCILDVSSVRQQDQAYFSKIFDELDHGGYEALMDMLLHTDLSEFNPRQLPKSVRSNGWDMMLRSQSTVVQWWYSCLDNGFMRLEEVNGEGEFPRWYAELSKPEAYGLYLRWCEPRKVHRPEMESVFGKQLSRFGIAGCRPTLSGKRCQVYRFPDLDEARELFSKAANLPDEHWREQA